MRPVFLEQHSVYSLCEGVPFISELVDQARGAGERYLALCDTNGFYGVVNFVARCREEGLIPLIGTRLRHFSFDGLLIARDMKGYAQISSLVSGVHLDRGRNGRGGTGDGGSGSGRECRPGPPVFNLKDRILRLPRRRFVVITRDRDILERGGEGVYAEINVLRPNYVQDYARAKKLGAPPVFISPVYFLKPEHHRLHRLLRAIHLNKKLDALEPGEAQGPYACWRDPGELAREYSFMPDALRNTRRIAEACSFEFSMGNVIAPGFCADSFRRLEELCARNLPRRYPRPTPRVRVRLDKELAVIREKGFADYFLIVHDLVRLSPYTCGRGSAAASLVSYLLFITHVDPLRHNLLFERFLNRERPDPPDIDVDFPWDTRDRILDYLFKTYGPRRTAMMSTHITFSSRSSVREVAKVYGIPEKEISRITGNIGFYYNRASDEFERYSKTRDAAAARSPVFGDIFTDAVAVHGRPRHLSVHCGGVVITPRPICYYIPVEPASKGVNVIQLEKDQAEEFGFVKIDVLGNRSLAVVRDVLEQVERHYGESIRYQELNPLDDRRTVQALARGETLGVFYVESPAMRQLQRKTGRGDYEHLVIHSSIIRPAANMYIREYIERLRGKPYTPLLPEMGEILKETYGIMCYQEDITRIARQAAGFPIGEAEEIRKVILRKSTVRRKLELKDKFFENLAGRGVAPDTVEQVWRMIESFSGYSFCKPHSASYALLSFKSCYLKTRYPAEFMGAVLKNGGGYYSPLAYISEARRLGLRVEKPDINLSGEQYRGQGSTVRLGLEQIKGLSSRSIRAVLAERERRGRFAGLYDFMERMSRAAVGPGIAEIVLLIKAGAFRNVESYNQPQLLYMAKSFHARLDVALAREIRSGPGPGLCPGLRPTPPPMRDIPREQKLLGERELFGFIVSCHPMEHYRRKLLRRAGGAAASGIVPAQDLDRFAGRSVQVAGILVTAKTVMTRNHQLMQFISFEDETALFETVFFPRVYKRHALSLAAHRPYMLTGKVEQEFGVSSLAVRDVRPLEELEEHAAGRVC